MLFVVNNLIFSFLYIKIFIAINFFTTTFEYSSYLKIIYVSLILFTITYFISFEWSARSIARCDLCTFTPLSRGRFRPSVIPTCHALLLACTSTYGSEGGSTRVHGARVATSHWRIRNVTAAVQYYSVACLLLSRAVVTSHPRMFPRKATYGARA